MIRLTRIDSNKFELAHIIDAESIESIEQAGLVTEISTKRGWVIKVKESSEEVARKVLEYRLGLMKYREAIYRGHKDDEQYEEWNLKHLSGLSAEKGADHVHNPRA